MLVLVRERAEAWPRDTTVVVDRWWSYEYALLMREVHVWWFFYHAVFMVSMNSSVNNYMLWCLWVRCLCRCPRAEVWCVHGLVSQQRHGNT